MMKALLRMIMALRHDNRGAAMIFVTAALPVIFAMASMSVDLGYVFYVRSRLQTAADLAALAGAKLLTNQTAATVKTKAHTIAWGNLPTQWSTGLNTITATVSEATSCLGTAPFSSTDCTYNSSGMNAIRVTVSATTPMFFAAMFGIKSETLTATSLAGSGNNSPPLDIVLVMDTTGSMNSSTSACGGSMTRQACAMKGVRAMLSTLWPSVANVSLMIYPGLKANYDKYEYCTTAGTIPGPPTGVAYYNSSPIYSIVADSTDYRLNPTSIPPGGINKNSLLVKAMGEPTSGCAGLQNIGGAGTYYGDVMAAAKTKLDTNAAALPAGSTKRQGVIIILSDGDANSTANSFAVTKQCQKGIDAAVAATTAKYWVYSIAYNASKSAPPSSCNRDLGSTSAGNGMSACQAMKEMASDSTKFYSVDANCNAGANSGVTDLSAIFKNIATSLMKTRRVSEAITN